MQSPTVMSLTRPPLQITIQVSLLRASARAQPITGRAWTSTLRNPPGSMAARASDSISAWRCRSSHR